MSKLTSKETTAQIALIGMGPRSLGALEALTARLQEAGVRLSADVFDPAPSPGCGPNFRPDEDAICLLNIPMRDISIRPPAFSSCGDFGDWLGGKRGADEFPTRAELGGYLHARYNDLLRQEALTLRHLSLNAKAVRQEDDGWWVDAGEARHGPYAEVLLTLGQPTVAPDPQLAAWQDYALNFDLPLAEAYPAKALIARAASWRGQTVAIRGLALSAFDILRALTVAQGGRFATSGYLPSGARAGADRAVLS